MSSIRSSNRLCTLGVRTEPRCLTWAVVGGSKEHPNLIASGKETTPAAFNEAESLGWFRKQLIFILEQYKPVRVAVRYPGGIAEGRTRTQQGNAAG
jgi:hypothetical protein